jgi:hypothetical protein
MSISFNNNRFDFNKPLLNVSGSKAVTEAKKDQNLEASQKEISKEADLAGELEKLAEVNKTRLIAKKETDSQSTFAASSFAADVEANEYTPAQVLALYGQYALQVSNSSPEAQKDMDIALSQGLFKAFQPITLMDSQSENAIANFKSALSCGLTRDEMVELFTRFSREISINFPAAWKELEGILSNQISNAKSTQVSMDGQSKNAISSFKSSLSDNMTKDEMVELFTRFSREISVNYPQAWKELSSILANTLAIAYVPNTNMDASSKGAISNFRSMVNSDLTKDEMVELFVRFSREISVKFPAAWKELTSVLNNNLGTAFKPDMSMDNQSRNAISSFKSTLNASMTKDQMIETFVRFSRLISVNYPQAWKELESNLSQQVPNAFKPVTTIDDNSKDLATEFVDRVSLEKLSSDELDSLFGEYLKGISLKFVDAKKKVETAYQQNTKKSEELDKSETKEVKTSEGIVKQFKHVVEKVNHLDNKVRQLSAELAGAENKNQINNTLQAINQIQGKKEMFDSAYNGIMHKAADNKVALSNLSDEYKTKLDVSKDSPEERELQEKEMKKLTRWDMLREMRRKEVLGILGDQKKDNLVEQLTSVPKFILKKILTSQVHAEQVRLLLSQKYPESMLREIPKGNAKKQLPKADDMLPVLMMQGRLSSGATGMELIKGIIVGDFKAEKPQNQTRAREELVPHIAEMMLNKPPKAAEALKATANVGKPRPASFQKMVQKDVKELAKKNPELVSQFLGTDEQPTAGRRDNKVDMNDQNKNRLPRLEQLSIGQLLELARDKVQEFSDDETSSMFRAKRGTSEEIGQFLESLDKVGSLAGAKLAVAVLYNHQQQVLKQAVLPHMSEDDMVNVTLDSGKDKEQMVKDMPWYTIQDQIKSLPKVQMMDSFKLLPKSEMIGAFKQLPSQVIASIAFDAVDRNTVSENLLNMKGFAAA